ncbi:hypothetical protein ACJX0J_039240, partial [Zea mays]
MGKEDALKDNQIIEKILFEIFASRDLNVMISIILSFDFVNFTRTVNLLQLAVSQARPILTCTRGIGQLHLLTFKHFQNKNLFELETENIKEKGKKRNILT